MNPQKYEVYMELDFCFALSKQSLSPLEPKMKSCGAGYCVPFVDQCGFIDLHVLRTEQTNSYNKNLCITFLSMQTSLPADREGKYWHVKFSTLANNNEILSFTWLSTGWNKVKGFMKFLVFRCIAGINQYCCNQLC